MNNIIKLASLLFVISILTSCSMEKRRYVSGYNFQWNSSKPTTSTRHNRVVGGTEQALEKIETRPMQNTFVEEVFASVKKINPTRIKKSFKVLIDSSEKKCDVILLNSGEEIPARVMEISKDSIKYRKCSEIDGPVFTLRKADVFMIKYPNGSKEVFRDSTVEKKEQKDSGVFGALSLFFVGLFILLAATNAFLGAGVLLLLLAGLVFGIIGMGRNRKNRGLAIAGFVVSALMILLIILFTLSYSWSWSH